MEDYKCLKVTHGYLRGKKTLSKHFTGGYYYSFAGIPYAKPPLGPLRFKAPQPFDSWEGVRDALSEGPSAPQFDDMVIYDYLGEEDCLYLNVYTRKIPTGIEEDLKPVMVWIHGGGFYMGSGNSNLYDPEYLLKEDVVLVTFNYRLGPLGFLTTQDSQTSSNNGLKDQVMALQWIQQNIAQFGGNPNNVTIFGCSSGAVSVHLHLFSPLSKDLFHRAIAMSGVVLNPWALIENPRDKAFRLGAVLGCKTTDSEKLVKFLQTVPAKELIESVEYAQTPEEKASYLLFFGPTVENGAANYEEVFIHDRPMNLIKQGQFHKVPFMTGVTSHEGMLILRDINRNPSFLNYLDYNKELLIPSTWNLNNKINKSEEIAQKIKKFYFGNKSIGEDTLETVVKFCSDIQFINGLKKTIELHTKNSNKPLYLYQFSVDEKLGMIEKFLGSSFPGVCHGADVAFFFKAFFVREEKLKPNTRYMKTVSKVVKLWTNFAKTGNPTPTQDPELNVTWNPVIASEMNYLDINEELVMKKHLAEESTAFWEGLESSL